MIDKPNEERNLIDRSRGVGKSFLYTLKSIGREGMARGNYVAVKGILPCVGYVGIVDAKLDISSAGVHSSVVELTSLAILPPHRLSSLINPTVSWFG